MKKCQSKMSPPWIASYPGAEILLPVFVFGIGFYSYLAYYAYQTGAPGTTPFFILGVISCIVVIFMICKNSICYIRILDDRVECFSLMTGRFSSLYTNCTVGLDYCWRGGRKVWWIYLSENGEPEYRHKNKRNRINAMPCKPGFIRILYRKEVSDLLLEVLPKRQKTVLISALRYKLQDKSAF